MDDDTLNAQSANSTKSRKAGPTVTPANEAAARLPADTATDTAGDTDANRDTRAADEFVNRVAGSLHDAVDQLAATAAPHVQELQDGIEEVEGQVREQAEQAKDWGQQCTEDLRSSVRQHPMIAIGTAFLVGLLLARLAR